MGKSSQAKGRRGERELSEILTAEGFPVRPGRACCFGQEADVVSLPGVHIEVKRRESVDLTATMKQAIRDSEYFQDGLPAAFHRGNRRPWCVTMLLDDWLKLYKSYIKESNDV